MLGAVQSSRNFNLDNSLKNKKQAVKAAYLTEALKRYYFNITNEYVEDYDEWAASSYDQGQIRPTSAY
jgi:hypothetical protein